MLDAATKAPIPDKLSADLDDPFNSPVVKLGLIVRANGIELENIIGYNIAEGLAVRVVIDNDGMPVRSEDGTLHRRLYGGHIEVSYPKPQP